MGIENNNPFIMPGFGQTEGATQNPLLASMDMMQRAWQGMAGAGGMDVAAMATPMSVEDLDKRITDLRAVESWLRLNLSMLSSTIQGLEVQRSTIATLMSFAAKVSPAGSTAGKDSAQSPLEAVLGNWPASFMGASAAPETAATSAAKEAASTPKDAAAAAQAAADQASDTATAYAASAETAVKGWWDLLQAQFDSLASATAASMQNADAASAPSNDTAASTSSKKAQAKKTVAKKATSTKAAATKAPAQATASKAGKKPATKATAKPAPKAARTATVTKAAATKKPAAKPRAAGKA